jgi:carotenoid cleavage dioxygenase-like enzyme
LSSGAPASGSNDPERASSYSRKKASKAVALEQRLRDVVVAAAGHPHTGVVAAAEMDAEAHAGDAPHHLVDEVDPLGQHALGGEPDRLGPVAHARVDERGELGRVDLDVLAAQRDQLLDLRAADLGGVGEHREGVGVGAGRVLRAPEPVEH